MILPIIQEPDKVLRTKSDNLELREIKSDSIQKLIRDMSDTLRSVDVGIGLAASQVGKPLRLFLVSEEAKDENKAEEVGTEKYNKAHAKAGRLVFINPEIKKISKSAHVLPEGCLSVNDKKGELIYGKVPRHDKVSVSAYDENGKKFTLGAKGLLAQVIQHEIDHLEGILFIDRAIEIRKLPVKSKEQAQHTKKGK